VKAVAGTHNPLVRGSSPREGIGFIELVGKQKEPALEDRAGSFCLHSLMNKLRRYFLDTHG
jgi:hypothetical protein